MNYHEILKDWQNHKIFMQGNFLGLTFCGALLTALNYYSSVDSKPYEYTQEMQLQFHKRVNKSDFSSL